MCVYLAPRWRRRSLLATLMLALTLLLTVDAARALRSVEMQHPTGSTTGSGSASVSEVQVGDLEAGVVTTDITQSTTTFTKKTWGAGSHSDASKKSVSFTSLVQSTATSAPSGERSIEEPKSASSASGSTDNEVGTPSATSNTKGKSATSAKQGDDDDSDGSYDLESSDDSVDSSSDSKTHDKTTGKSGTSKSNTSVPAPTPTPTPTSAPTYPQPTHPGSINIKQLSWSEPTMHPQTPQPGSAVVDTKPVTGSSSSASASGQPVKGQSYEVSGSTNNAASFEKSTKSAASTTSSRSLDETLVFVIVGVVGVIGALLMFVSRKVLQETGDDQELTGASFF